MAIITRKNFLTDATSATISETLPNINLGSALVLEFTGDASAFSASVQGIVSDYGTDWSGLKLVNLGTFETTTAVTSNGIYLAIADGIVKLRVNLASVSGGSVSCVAKLAD